MSCCVPLNCGGGGYPLIVGFHGYRGDVKAWLPDYTAFDQFIPGKEFIIAYPEGPIQWDSDTKRTRPAFSTRSSAKSTKSSRSIVRAFSFRPFQRRGFSRHFCSVPVRRGRGRRGALRNFPLGYQRSPAPLHKAPLFVIWGEKMEFSPPRPMRCRAISKPIRKRAFPWKRWCCRTGATHGAAPRITWRKKFLRSFRPTP